ncbi:MAG: type I-C CRISPR-associated protein Cas8c/Csd1, partial [Oscillospiraceae bacterium]
LEHRPAYIFGLNYTKDGLFSDDRTKKAEKSHQAFVEKQLEFIQELNSPIINAYRNFVSDWVPQNEEQNPYLVALGKDISTSGFAFCLAGHPDIMLHEDDAFLKAYKNSLSENTDDDDSIKQNCAILGEKLPIERVHSKIKGVAGGLSTGTTLVGFNSPAEESYGKVQSFNSNISKQAMQQYTEALNYLLKDKTHKSMLDDITVVHFAISENDIYNSIIQDSLFNDFKEEENTSVGFFEEEDDERLNATETSNFLKDIMRDANEGAIHSKQILSEKDINPDVVFYMMGFKPNVSRLAVKFVYRKKFGALLQNIVQHQIDLQMSENAKPIPIWKIKKELISPKSTIKTLDPALASKLLESIVYGYNYPDFLLQTIVRRIKTDSNDEKNKYIKINLIRVGIVKACLNRKNRLSGKKEEFSMSLDTDNNNPDTGNKNPAYLCGRLFAVLEKLQQDASGGTLNRTIKDAYFSSACSNPAIIFPKLLRLAQYHLRKVKKAYYWNCDIAEISEKLNGEFPSTLPLVEQGKFILGYYHQFFAKSEKKVNEENNNGGTEND